MMTVSVYDAEVQEVCDAASKAIEDERVEWLRKVNMTHSKDWFDKQILEYARDYVFADGCDGEVITVIESLVLAKYAFYIR